MTEILLVVLAIGGGAFIQGAVGFGSALIAMPLMSLVLPVAVAAPIQGLAGGLIAAGVLYRHREFIRFREAGRLALASALGLPFGLLLLKYGAPGIVTRLLGGILLIYGGYSLFLAPRLEREAPVEGEPRWARAGGWIAGIVSGVLGGAYTTNGPPVVVYGALRRWPKGEFKAILQTYFLMSDALIILGHAASGLITRQVGLYSLYALPALGLGLYLGFHLDRRLDAQRFRTALLGLILVLGASLLLR